MAQTEALIREYRNGLWECEHRGIIARVDEKGLTHAAGDAQWVSYYRSASKPIQALCAFMMGIPEKYGLTDEEAAIFSGSHRGEDFHMRALTSILEKTGLREEQLVMLPAYPGDARAREAVLRANLPPRKLYHNCAGKHLCMMLATREMGAKVEDYWRVDSPVQKRILRVLSAMTDVPEENIQIGVDGCGVPVYAVPLCAMAKSFMRLANPELIPDDKIAEAAARNVKILHAHPTMLSGTGDVSAILSADPRIIAKGGALGVYAMGIAGEKSGIAFKVMDGAGDDIPMIVRSLLERFGMANLPCHAELTNKKPEVIKNDLGQIVGEKKAVFSL